MGTGTKILGAVMLGALLITVLQKYALIILGLFILYYLIRWCADIFWWGRDKGKW